MSYTKRLTKAKDNFVKKELRSYLWGFLLSRFPHALKTCPKNIKTCFLSQLRTRFLKEMLLLVLVAKYEYAACII